MRLSIRIDTIPCYRSLKQNVKKKLFKKVTRTCSFQYGSSFKGKLTDESIPQIIFDQSRNHFNNWTFIQKTERCLAKAPLIRIFEVLNKNNV